jgi:hypothetical protein
MVGLNSSYQEDLQLVSCLPIESEDRELVARGVIEMYNKYIIAHMLIFVNFAGVSAPLLRLAYAWAR